MKWLVLLLLLTVVLNVSLWLTPMLRRCAAMDFFQVRGAVAFGLYGPPGDQGDRYWGGARRNMQLWSSVWPSNWVPVLFVPEGTNTSSLFGINGTTPRVVAVSSHVFGSYKLENTAMFYRFLAADLHDYDVFLVRDIDSRPLLRDRAAVEEFVSSTYCFHSLHDHPYHSVALLGGMWGAKRGTFARPMADMISRYFLHYPPHAPKGIDQDFLYRVVFQQVRWRTLDHSSVGKWCTWWPLLFLGSRRPFPTGRRLMDEFVGSACMTGATDSCSVESLPAFVYNECGLIS